MALEKEMPGSWKDKRSTIPSWAVAFIWLFFLEWLMEWVAYWFSRWALIEILGYIARFSILVAVIVYFAGADERRQQAEEQTKAKHYQAWQIINAATGKPGDGGRTIALEDLHKDGVSLARIDLSGAKLGRFTDSLWIGVDIPGALLSEAVLRGTSLRSANLKDALMNDCYLDSADLSGVDLSEADLTGANFTGANLFWARLYEADLFAADLTGADLTGADLTRANLYGANFTGANLSGARLTEARLTEADLTGANFTGANLSGARLYEADLSRAYLYGADLTGADLAEADLSGANFTGANLSGAKLRGANIRDIIGWEVITVLRLADVYGVVSPPEGFREWAVNEMGALCIESFERYESLRDSLQDEAERRGQRPGRLQPANVPCISGTKAGDD